MAAVVLAVMLPPPEGSCSWPWMHAGGAAAAGLTIAFLARTLPHQSVSGTRRGDLEPLNRVAALDPGRRTSPGAARYPVLVKSESSGVAEMFVNLPHQWVTGRRHGERNAALFSARQHDMSIEILHDDGNVVAVTAHKLSAQINITH